MNINYTRKAKVIKVVDGDTIDVEIDLGFHITIQQRVRLLGINTAEVTAQDIKERKLALDAKEMTTKLLMDKDVTLTTSKPLPQDKYGRYLAEVLYIDNGKVCNISTVLLESGLARPYVEKS